MPRRQQLRETIPFNSGWKFIRGDAPDARGRLSYAKLRPWLLAHTSDFVLGAPDPKPQTGNPGARVSYVDPEFDDAAWRSLELPHDWGIEGPFDGALPGETGKLPWQGVGWYRKSFHVSPRDKGRRHCLRVDGAMAFSSFWLNGSFIGGWPYGYTSFLLDLTPHLHIGRQNVLAVRLENPPDSSRWYPGSGLYRNVWLLKTSPVHIAHFGVFIQTPRVSRSAAVVHIDVTVEHHGTEAAELELATEIYAMDESGRPQGPLLARAQSTRQPSARLKLARGERGLRTLTATLKRPKLWSLERRHRYVAVTRLSSRGKAIDEVHTPFGVRTVGVDPHRGFLLNERPVKLNGVCLHHDLGALGSAVHERAIERQIRILQAMGANAIRTSHNPPAPELLELCDRLGMLVMVEAFDCWRRGKKWPKEVEHPDLTTPYFDYAQLFDDWHERDLRAMVRRDRNHPSVVMWSIGNEVIEQWLPDGWPLATRLAGIVREEDRTRPVTAAFNGEQAGYSGFQTALDVLGYNYRPWAYEPLHEENPGLPLLGAETASTISSRGEYFFPVSSDKLEGRANFHVSSYDLCATEWATLPDEEFAAQDRCPYVAGEFVWTGFDYLGEPTPYNSDATNLLNFTDEKQRQRASAELEALGRIQVPSRSSYFGIVDLAGFPKDRYFIYQARWRPSLKMAHILPHWTWPERVGQVTPVHVYSSGDEAELFLNGKSLGRKRKRQYEYRFRWDHVVYQPGVLRVVTYKAGKRWAVTTRRTAGPASRLRLEADRHELSADGRDLVFVRVEVSDERGELVPRASNRIQFEVTGPATLVGVDNGDPTSFESFQARERRAFNGLALAILKTVRGRAGRIVLTARADGLVPAQRAFLSRRAGASMH